MERTGMFPGVRVVELAQYVFVPGAGALPVRYVADTSLVPAQTLRSGQAGVRYGATAGGWESAFGAERGWTVHWGDCRWPVGDPRMPTFGFCALPKWAGSRHYCEWHHRRAHREDELEVAGGGLGLGAFLEVVGADEENDALRIEREHVALEPVLPQ